MELKLHLLRVLFALEICLLAFILIKLSGIEGWLPRLILIICFSLLVYEACEMRNTIETEYRIDLNFKEMIKIRSVILLIAILLFFLSPFYLPPIIKHHVEEYTQSETAKSNLHRLVSDITGEYNDEANKTKAILRWFDQDSGDINNIYGKKHLLLKIYPLHVYADKPYICVRLIKHENPLRVLKSRCGACEEYAMFFMEMANVANLTVRSIHDHGEDHNWDEVLIDGKWTVVDPSIVNLKNNETGFNISQRFYEEEWWNISYVFALYPNGTKEDVTYRYTNLGNLTIITLDENKNLVSNVSVQIFSNNHATKKRLNIGANCTTDSKGSCEIKIGGGNYTIKGEKKDDGIYLSAETAITLEENKNSNIQLMLKKDRFWWLQSFLVLVLIILCCIGLWGFIVLWIETKNYERDLKSKPQLDR